MGGYMNNSAKQWILGQLWKIKQAVKNKDEKIILKCIRDIRECID